MPTSAVLTAAGAGNRLGHDRPKALATVAGASLVVHAARRLVESGVVSSLVVSAPPGHGDEVRRQLDDAELGVPVVVVDGGASRQASVAAALAVVPADVDVVLVHDAARALVPTSLVVRVERAVRDGHPAVVPGLAVTDTIKQIGAQGVGGAPVVATVDRTRLRSVQTPQGFDRELLDRAHTAGLARAATEATAATDDATLVEALGVPVWLVDGDEGAFKVTTARDLSLAELVLASFEEGRA